MTRPYDLERGLAEVARSRADAGELGQAAARMGDKLADGVRADFDTTLDIESVGAALVIAAASLLPLTDDRDIPSGVLVDVLAFAGEQLVRTARARAAEATEVEGVLCEHVLTWHPVDEPDDALGMEIPLYEHIDLPDGIGELRSHTREVSGG